MSPPSVPVPMTVAEVLNAYRKFAQTYYSKDGRTTKEFVEMKHAGRTVRKLYGGVLATEFGPLALKAVRQHMISEEHLSRGVVNNRVNRIKRIFKWAVSEELVPSSVFEALRTVTGLRYGRTEARETEPVRPVAWDWVKPVLECVAAQVATMIELQWLTRMRPCEVVLMRACDIDMNSEVWVYEPHEHKNRWRGHQRLVPLGPGERAIIQKFLKSSTTAFLFSPQDAETWRNNRRRSSRRTKMTPSQGTRRPKTNPRRAKRERYDVDSYRRAIQYGIERSNKSRQDDENIPAWFPPQLRHSRATELRKKYGIEAAQVVLGHKHAAVTEVYAERNLEKAIELARETG
ncbi:MAG: site-specific integrase [Planctomycetaceae bacterium]|nr:site-specific integrase [Planctomycetaceae bacterium]